MVKLALTVFSLLIPMLAWAQPPGPPPPPSPIPEPTTALLVGTGLLGGYLYRRFKGRE